MFFSPFIQLFLAMRTLQGHRSSCTTIDFHPYTDFLTSGSLDTNVKVKKKKEKKV